MSLGRLKNPLDGFQTYSTQFVLLACRTTEKAKLFSSAEPQKQGAILQAIDRVTMLGEPVTLEGSNNDVFLVLDTRRFAQFSVEKLKYEAFINGLSTGKSHANLTTQIEMTIHDSVGISFVNYIQWLMDTKMQCGFDGMVFMLRILFVGHKDDGSSNVVQTVSIPMHLFSMDLNLDYRQGVYDCVFMPNLNFDVDKHSRWTTIGNAVTYFTGKGTTRLDAIINSFERELNLRSQKFYNDTEAELRNAGKISNATGKFGRSVQYQITIPDTWKSFVVSGPSINSAVELDFIKKKKDLSSSAATSQDQSRTPAQDAHITVEPAQTITDVLDIIFDQIPEIKELANSDRLKQTDKQITFYKYLVSVSSDDKTFIVHVDVIPFEVPNVRPQTKEEERAKLQTAESSFYKPGTREPLNYFELDYIFSGKNLDVLNMDLKIQHLQFLLASNINVGEGELFGDADLGQVDRKTKEGQKGKELLSSRAYDPILIPLTSSEQKKNFSDFAAARSATINKKQVADAQDYSKNLSAFYAQSPIMASVTIKGNPHIMQKFTLEQPVLHENAVTNTGPALSTTNTSVKDAYRADLETRILGLQGIRKGATRGTFSVDNPIGAPSYVSTPVFVRVNIFGPNVDFVSNELLQGEQFASRILNDSYFVVFKVVNVIERGVFTQQLELYGHNIYGINSLTSQQLSSKQPQVIR